ncbi:MAG: lipd A biosynthesis protein [Muribaculaceae bacterium]|nr:lipd A biosynthesis protein [Muribaculaceae bacterium]
MTLEKFLYNSAMALSRLPWWLLYGVASFAGWLMATFKLYRYRIVHSNIALAFPELTDAERRKIERGFYRQFADNVVETLKLMTVSNESLRRKVEFVGWEQLEAVAAEHRSVVLFLGHYGNWELVPTIVWAIPDEYIKGQIFKVPHNPLGHTVLERIRSRFNAENIPQEHAFFRLVRQNRAGLLTCTGFLADQRPNGRFHAMTTFLGLPTAYVTGAEEIGRRINAAYYYIDVEPTGRGRTRLTLKPVVAAADEQEFPVTVGYLRMLEATIRRNPAPWLWSHNRWLGQLDHPADLRNP